VRRIPFARPFFSEDAIRDILGEIEHVLRSGWLTSGPKVKEFEEQFGKVIGTRFAVATNSGTAALHSLLQGLGLSQGDEVIVPANTFVATSNAVLYLGAKPIVADIDIQTFNISIDSVNERITSKTRAIVAVHIGGNPCDMKALREIADDKHLHLIEDCAHAHGARIGTQSCGTFGEAAAFSFHPTKVITSAEGGMVVTDSERLAERVKTIRNQGRSGYGPREITELGYNYRMTEINAAVGIRQLRELDSFVRERHQIAARYRGALKRLDWARPQMVREGNTSSYCAFLILLENSQSSRDSIRENMQRFGVETSVLYHPFHLQPFYRDLFSRESFSAPVSELFGKLSLALPMWNGLKDEDIDYVVTALSKAAVENSVHEHIE
jgi:perosamine synthetase